MTSPDTDAPHPKSPPLRARLIDEAMVLLEREGAEAITLRSLAAAVGVSHMAPYRHFRDKEALLAALAERGFLALGTAMQAAGARRAAAGAAPRDAFLSFGLAYLDFARTRPQLYHLMFGPALAGKVGHPDLAAAGAATFGGLAQAVGGVIAADDPIEVETHAIATWAMAHGLAMLLLDGRLEVVPGSAEEAALVEQVLRVHGRSFRPSDPPP